MTHPSNVVAMTGAIRSDLPTCCTDCVFWQTLTGTIDAGRKDRWVRAFEDAHGSWGRALFDGDAFTGLVQYGPAIAFPRARSLPAGPPNQEGAVLTCSYLTEGDPAGALERLLLEALADLKARAVATVDAFAIGAGDARVDDAALIGHHTLFRRQVLAGLGFRDIRARGPITLMRLELRGLQPADQRTQTAATAPAAAPVPG